MMNLAAKNIMGSRASGGSKGFTVTFANDFSLIQDGGYLPASAPFYMVSPDGTTTTVDLVNYASLRDTSYQNIAYVYSGNWIKNEDAGFRELSYIGENIGAQIVSPYARGVIMESNGIECGIISFVSTSQLNYSSNDYLLGPWDRGMLTSMSLLTLFGDLTVKSAKSNIPCLLKGTLIRLASGADKPIEEVTYDDELLVWDFDEGKLSSAKPLWIKKAQKADYWFRNKLADGRELLTTGQSKTGWGHRMFDIDKGSFRYTTETVSDSIFTLDGAIRHSSCERIESECEHYNIITDRHMNLFANGILTSCSYNNLYPIADMKFVKNSREHRLFESYDVPIKYYVGLRLSEQEIDVEKINEYVGNLVNLES